ncbi:MAG: LCP family protein [Candidatus Gracilibacteria bacterium]
MKKNPLKRLKLLEKVTAKMPYFVLALTILAVVQFLGNAGMAFTLNRLDSNNATLIDEMGRIQTSLTTLGDGLNETRQVLGLPAKEYVTSFLTSEDVGEDTEDTETVEAADPIVEIFNVIEKLGEEEAAQALYEKTKTDLEAYFNATENIAYFESKGLYLRNGVSTHLADADGRVIFTIGILENGDIAVTSYKGTLLEWSTEDGTGNFETFKQEFKTLLDNVEDAKAWIDAIDTSREVIYTELTTNTEIQAILTEKGLTIGSEQETTYHFVHSILRKDGVALLEIVLDKETGMIWAAGKGEPAFGQDVSFDELNSDKLEPFTMVEDQSIFAPNILPLLTALDARTEFDKSIEDTKAAIESLRNDEGFNALLQKYGFTFTFDPTETEKTIEYTILEGPEIFRILYIDKTTGELKLKEPGQETGSLLKDVLIAESVEFTLPTAEALANLPGATDTAINILVMGKHGSNVDTMIFTHIDPTQQTVTMVSIPRDLYYNNRKINSVYATYGMGELLREISDITGYPVSQYILVDMYVFIDLVDLVGGVDVTLTEDLIDPTYHVYENGVESTLYYAAGDYHFTGVQALRIARSRHSTSDYSRAERQQLILSALKDKAKTLGLGDATTFAKLIKTCLDETETNLGVSDVLSYFFRFKDFTIKKGNVLSTANVLASVQVPVNFVTSLRTDSCGESGVPATVVAPSPISPDGTATDATTPCTIQYAVYTLSPRDGNWDYIKWYFRDTLEK